MRSLFLVVFCFGTIYSFAQKNTYQGFPSLTWPKLYNVTWQKQKDDQDEFGKPIFAKETLALAGKEITLPGYMVPFENGMKGSHFILSSLPLNACFFCGVGGPESVVEVFLTQAISYSDKPIEVKGILYINTTDPDQMIYVLKNAELMGEIEF